MDALLCSLLIRRAYSKQSEYICTRGIFVQCLVHEQQHQKLEGGGDGMRQFIIANISVNNNQQSVLLTTKLTPTNREFDFGTAAH